MTPKQERELLCQASELYGAMSSYQLMQAYLNVVAGLEFHQEILGPFVEVKLDEAGKIGFTVMAAELQERNLLRPH